MYSFIVHLTVKMNEEQAKYSGDESEKNVRGQG